MNWHERKNHSGLTQISVSPVFGFILLYSLLHFIFLSPVSGKLLRAIARSGGVPIMQKVHLKNILGGLMKNIETILSENGITLTEDQKSAVNKAVLENYKTASDYQNQVDKEAALQNTLNETREKLKKFDGVDLEELKGQIAQLNTDLQTKSTEYEKKISDMEFASLLEKSISKAKGRNAKAITALLDLDTLKASKNQENDIAAALKTLSEAEDSSMLFGDNEQILGSGNPIGSITKNNGQPSDATMRAIMGLPAETK